MLPYARTAELIHDVYGLSVSPGTLVSWVGEASAALQGTADLIWRATSEGKTLGRPSKTTAEQRAEIVAKYEQRESVSALARLYAVSRANILGVVKPA
ncbi:MAG: hypothetical protein V4724_20955 [Pseudomonadota bacterium]